MFEQYSTRVAGRGERLEYWNHLIGGIFTGMVVDSDTDIDASWKQCTLGDINFAIADSPKARISRWHSRSLPPDRSGRVIAHIQNIGYSLSSQRYRDANLNAGDLALCIPHEPYELQISDRNQAIVLDMPESRLTEIYPDWESTIGHTVSTGALGSALLRNFLALLHRHCWQSEPCEEEAQALAEIVWQLLGLSLTARKPDADAGSPDVAAAVTSFVERHLTDPEMSTSTIARSMSLSPRTVQNVFAAMATTPTEFVLTRRLNRAAEILSSAMDCGSITDLAFDLGFNDSAYFTRRFKSRFGVTPTSFRASRRN